MPETAQERPLPTYEEIEIMLERLLQLAETYKSRCDDLLAANRSLVTRNDELAANNLTLHNIVKEQRDELDRLRTAVADG